MLSDHEKRRYARQIALPQFGKEAQEKLLRSSVLVIGAGGLGCPALIYLAGAGLGRIGIVDHDLVSLSNLHRQIIYNVDDIGKQKADCASNAIKALNPDLKVNIYPFALNTENAWDIVSQYDVIIDGTDHFATRYMINDVCALLGKPLIYGAVSGFEGQLAVFNATDNTGRKSVNYRDLFPVPPQEELIPNCEEAGVLGVLPGIIGTMQANETIKIISGIGTPLVNQLMTYNSLQNSFYQFDISAAKDSMALIPANRKEFEEKNYEFDCADPSKAIFTIDLDTFKTFIEKSDVLIIDVREFGEMPEVTEFRHLQMPMSSLNAEMHKFQETTIVAFCQIGQRSLIAARTMNDFFGATKKVYSLGGGIVKWKKSHEHEGKGT